ncbi:uncharacterized protein AB675_11859 [Cyphellophora attinorum]|uniref:Extracellular serine-rich protein n=1 Tax=Cyphellophora attinorum TaxID=1664694 RepID=A0A0N1H011_9EURO|nr:uncharacterized protein AB675_11859 [Phialophora attinorum]KPI36870.1 hypothetical protein AB675_11859 [Phialophora attinorum]
MRYQMLTTAALAAVALADDSSSASATTTGIPATSTYDIKVGSDNLKFDPETLTASPGDLLNFHFYNGNHSVAQSSYDSPCQAQDNGIFSGFFAGGSGKDEDSKVFSMRLNDTNPMWLYCAAGEHCKAGMGMVINAPSGSDQTLSSYKDKAKSADVKVPSSVYGGVVHDKPQGTTTASASSASATKKSGAAVVAARGSMLGLVGGLVGVVMLL